MSKHKQNLSSPAASRKVLVRVIDKFLHWVYIFYIEDLLSGLLMEFHHYMLDIRHGYKIIIFHCYWEKVSVNMNESVKYKLITNKINSSVNPY